MSTHLKKITIKFNSKIIFQDDLVELLLLSQKDYKNGKAIKQSELKEQVKSWAKK